MKREYSILVAGVGNIGLRHFESLLNNRYIKNYILLDKKNSNLEIAKLQSKKYKAKNFFFYDNVNSINQKKIDLAIISTSSDYRFLVFKNLCSKLKIKFILFEKFLFQSISQLKKTNKILKKNKIKAWVNCSRRMWPFFINLKKKQIKKNIIEIVYSGSNWGIGSNAVHFLDIFLYLIDGKIFKIDNSKLDKKIYMSKRKNFIEFGGSLSITTKRGDVLKLSDSKKIKTESFFSIRFKENKILIFPNKKSSNCLIYKNNKLNKKTTFKSPLQSELTNTIFNNLIKFNNCNLSSYKESSYLHEKILISFKDFLFKVNKKKVSKVLIT